jgi:hypothetical protein
MATYKKDINLLTAMTKKKPRVNPFALIIPLIVFVALGAGITVSIFEISAQTAQLTMQRDDLQTYLDSPRVANGKIEAQNLQAQANEVQALASEVKGTLFNLSSYPDLTGENIQAIYDLAGYEIELTHFSYDRRTGALSFSASCWSGRQVPYFVQALRECGIFSDVQYQGYANETHTVTGSPLLDPVTETYEFETWEEIEYHYEISCLVASPAPTLPPLGNGADAGGEPTDEGGE